MISIVLKLSASLIGVAALRVILILLRDEATRGDSVNTSSTGTWDRTVTGGRERMHSRQAYQRMEILKQEEADKHEVQRDQPLEYTALLILSTQKC
jgi:hypothetical protein